MSLFCGKDGDYGDADWWWHQPEAEAPLSTKRSRKCCSCGQKVGVGDAARKIARYRPPTEFEEMLWIACDEVPMSDWYLCETCGDLADSLSELGFCYQLGNGESLKQQIAEYRRDEGAQEDNMTCEICNDTGWVCENCGAGQNCVCNPNGEVQWQAVYATTEPEKAKEWAH